YKPSNVLPVEIQDSINKTSAELEGLDEKFELIMWDVGKYRNELDVPIDAPSLRKYLLRNFGDIPDFKTESGSLKDTQVVDQLHSMGINTLAALERLIPRDARFVPTETELMLPDLQSGFLEFTIRRSILMRHTSRFMGCSIPMITVCSRSLE
ncbi:MAG: hypothetical protein ACRD8Z_16955, partial [Nitrososphaeraceae archaeon]